MARRKKTFTKDKIIKRKGFTLLDLLMFPCDRFYIAHNSPFIYAAGADEYYARDTSYFGEDISTEMIKGDIRFQVSALEEIERKRFRELWEAMPYQPMGVYFDELDEAFRKQDEERMALKDAEK